jgi:hypothetical protein
VRKRQRDRLLSGSLGGLLDVGITAAWVEKPCVMALQTIDPTDPTAESSVFIW